MEIAFAKYQGAGNDFIICDDRGGGIFGHLDQDRIATLCDRRFGIGADGLMLLSPAAPPYDFEMVYFNSDGRRSSMCGNGGRCIIRYAADIGIERDVYRFIAVDGPHEATILNDGDVSLGMTDVTTVMEDSGNYVLDTGSPHYIRFVNALGTVDIVGEGRAIRRSPPFAEVGINVNFVQENAGHLLIGTYERGVEGETLACGTGVTAAVIAHLHKSEFANDREFHVRVTAKGGELAVRGRREGKRYRDLRLIGPATRVYSGSISI